MSSSAMQMIPLPFIREDAKIRITSDKPPLISVIDMIMSVCETNNNHAWVIFKRLSNEVTTKCSDFKFPGRGQRDTPICTLDTILIIMQHLPGAVAAKNREKTAETMRRYFAGDPTLHDEIDRNATSSDPVCRIARASMPEVAQAIPTAKRASEVTNDELYQLQLAEKRLDIDERVQALEIKKARDKVNFFVESMRILKSEDLDDISKGLLKDYIQSSLVMGTSVVYNNEDQPITVSDRVVELGQKLDYKQLQNAGIRTKDLYTSKYNEEPAKVRRNVNGRWLDVNAYKRRDIPLIDQAVESALAVGKNQRQITQFTSLSQQ
eukprot:310983-Hanusia_phi.AAC.3